MPVIGLGTFGSSIAEAVKGAIEVGYRHIDCVAVYSNERLVGQSLQHEVQTGIRREDLWINVMVDKNLLNDRRE